MKPQLRIMKQHESRPTSCDSNLSRLQQQEERIQKSFIEVGLALSIIRDDELWQADSMYASFEDYCQRKWDIGKSQASKWIAAARVAVDLRSANIDIPNKTIGYELHLIPQRQREAAVRLAQQYAAMENRPHYTAADIQRAANEIQGTLPPAVRTLADALEIKDTERLMILKRWYHEPADEDNKWDALVHSGVLDPGDGQPPLVFASATVAEILQMERRWSATVYLINDDKPFQITGNVSQLIVDGQPLTSVNGIPLKNRRVKLTIEFVD